MKREEIRWAASFVVLMGIFYWIDQSAWFQAFVLNKLSFLTANATVWILSFIGLHLQQAGAILITPTGPVEIAESCTGSFVFLMFVAAILPFPSSWKSRFKGLALGFLTLLFINLFRTSLIVLMVSRFPGSLWPLHMVVGQIMVISAMLGAFLWSLKRNRQAILFPFLRSNKSIFRTLSLFTIGYLGGYWLYHLFLASPLGIFIKKLIETNMLWITSSLNDLLLHTQLTQLSAAPVRLIEGCLSSPMVVVFVAVVFSWPTNWWKRGVTILLGFVPFFYVYHLLRTILVSVTLRIQPKEVNFVYNFYGQALLIIALFAWVAYSWCSKRKTISYGKFLRLFLASGLMGVVVALGLEWFALHIIIPFLTNRISGSPLLSYNPDQIISTMTGLQVFIWVSLVGTTPGLSWSGKWIAGLSGILAALTGLFGVVLLVETFQLAPHKGFFKAAVISLPFVAYCLWCFHPKKQVKFHQKESER
ncbi:MAG: archaeosortase/exosortase family protein [Nitrospina sp.]|jgi:exosortase/archaeosortase family protein|nr:archaeosortase/exosortase family protein [Nitrospina sp.]